MIEKCVSFITIFTVTRAQMQEQTNLHFMEMMWRFLIGIFVIKIVNDVMIVELRIAHIFDVGFQRTDHHQFEIHFELECRQSQFICSRLAWTIENAILAIVYLFCFGMLCDSHLCISN